MDDNDSLDESSTLFGAVKGSADPKEISASEKYVLLLAIILTCRHSLQDFRG